MVPTQNPATTMYFRDLLFFQGRRRELQSQSTSIAEASGTGPRHAFKPTRKFFLTAECYVIVVVMGSVILNIKKKCFFGKKSS